MNLTQVTALLTKAAVFDRRTFAEPDVRAWHEVLAKVDVQTAFDAVAFHYARKTRWIMPGDVMAFARSRRRKPNDGHIGALTGPPSWARPEEMQAFVSQNASLCRQAIRARRSTLAKESESDEREAKAAEPAAVAAGD